MTQKFMNSELRAIRDSLVCAHCRCVFQGSDSQAWKVKYEQRNVYCSTICRQVGVREKFSKPMPTLGPCRHCGAMFASRRLDKVFCSLGCYTASDQFREMSARNRELTPETRDKIRLSLQKGETVSCEECGAEVYSQRRRRRRFCTTVCYRAFMAKRFDRWIANPERLSLPQCYDEFLDRQELACVVAGCTWSGLHLTLHINWTHGAQADEFKRAAGFNLSTGVIARPLAERLQGRPGRGVAVDEKMRVMGGAVAPAEPNGRYVRYHSLEAREHYRKARALVEAESGPIRICAGCGIDFQQSTPMGRAKYCTRPCRERAYTEQRRAGQPLRNRGALA